MAKILHLITGLDAGGAQGVLTRLCLNESLHTHIVVSMMDKGIHGKLLEDRGISVVCLNMSRGALSLRGIIRLLSVLRSHRPDVLQTWMPHADLLGGILGRLAGVPAIYWNIRNGTYDRKLSKLRTRLIVVLLSWLSWVIPSKIVVCAMSARDEHVRIGFRSSKMLVISNGFQRNPETASGGGELQPVKKVGLRSEPQVVGMLARFDMQKDHLTFLRAFELVAQHNNSVSAVLAGPGVDDDNVYLTGLLRDMGLTKSVALLGPQNDIPRFMGSIDIHVLSSSFGEAFPNVLAEAMLYEVPCIATDVGDARRIIGDRGWVVPPSKPASLANAINLALSLQESELVQLGRQSRERIEAEFSLGKMIDQYTSLYGQG